MIIPGRTEIILKGRLEKKGACKTGIISSSPELDQSHIHVANIVVSSEDRQVPIRVLNSSEEPMEVMKGKKIANFYAADRNTIQGGECDLQRHRKFCMWNGFL